MEPRALSAALTAASGLCLLGLAMRPDPGLSAIAAARGGPLGVGVALVNPTGLTANYFYRDFNAIAFAVGWGSHNVDLHLDHLWYRKTPYQLEELAFDPYLGIGLRLEQFDERYKDDKSNVGLRVPLGVAYRWQHLQAYAELGPALNVIEDSSFLVDLNLGARYYF